MPYFVYILRNSRGRLYIGQTRSLSTRLKGHKGREAAKFIRDHGSFQLIYTEQFSTRLDAMRRERQLKRWSRVKKEALIAGDLHRLKDL